MRRFIAIALSSTLMFQVVPLIAAPAMRGARAGVQPPLATGTINGSAQSSAGQTLPNFTMQVRNLKTGQLAGTTTSSAEGSFSFAGLSPADYVVEVVNAAGAIVGSSSAIVVTAGATVTVTVSVSAMAPAAMAGAAGGGISKALVVTTVAAAAGIAGVVVVKGKKDKNDKQDASPSR